MRSRSNLLFDFVIPAKAGIQCQGLYSLEIYHSQQLTYFTPRWIPAFAGMTCHVDVSIGEHPHA